MRKMTFTLALMLVVSLTFAQITINPDDMPDVGDTIRTSSALTTGGVDYTLTGENFTWDFSTLGIVNQKVDTFVSVSSTPFLYQIIFLYPFVATIASPQPDFDFIPGFEVTDAYLFYKETDNFFGMAGLGVNMAGIPLPLKFDDPDIYYQFPVEYDNIDSSIASFSLNIPELGFYSTERNRKNTVDGWGTLITPYGSFPTIRIKSELEIHDSIYIDSLGFGFPVNRSIVEYKWLGNGFGIPLLQVTVEGLLTTVSYIDSLRNPLQIIKPQAFNNEILVYPNPCSSYLNVEQLVDSPENYSIELYNPEGKRIYFLGNIEVDAGMFKQRLDLEHLQLQTGIYFLKMYSSNHSLTKKIIVQ